jgi:uncharacterized protein (TIGR03435 family)
MRRAAFFVFPLVLFSQVAAPPTFEVASVKQNNSPEPRSEFNVKPNGVTITNYRLQFLIPYAFHIPAYALAGAPAWLDSNKYDIIARAPAGSSDDQLRLMLQQLLMERFKLQFHRENKDLAGYALVLAKDGPKFTIEKQPDQPGKDDGRVGAGRGMARGHMVPASSLALTLGLYLGRPVLDQTGIDGPFNFELHWTPDETERQPGSPPPAAEPPASNEPTGPSLFAAIQEQLGLKLNSQRTSVEMLVIDHLQEIPTEN